MNKNYPPEIIKQAEELIEKHANTTNRQFIGRSEMLIKAAIVSCQFALSKGTEYFDTTTRISILEIKEYLEGLL